MRKLIKKKSWRFPSETRLSIMRTAARNEIRADLNVFYDLTGISNQELPYNTPARDLFNSSWEDLKRRPRNRGISLIFSVPIWDWGVNKAEMTSARASLQISEMAMEEEKKDVVNSIRSVVRQVKMAENRLEVLEKNQEVAQKSYDISLERFNNGEITSQELLIDSDRLTSAKMSYLGAYISYKLAVADLKRKTFWDFENDLPI